MAQGYGITLKAPPEHDEVNWHTEKFRRDAPANFVAIDGIDGTGILIFIGLNGFIDVWDQATCIKRQICDILQRSSGQQREALELTWRLQTG